MPISSHQLTAQGIGSAESCDYKKGFGFDSSGLLMTRDVSYNGNTEVLPNDYIYDNMGRKIVERNSAGVSTVYVYDSLDRVVFTFFGCSVDNNSFGTLYNPYNFSGDDSAGEDGTGVTFQTVSGQFPYSGNATVSNCEYYRKYKYDVMSNLTETYFFEYWGVNQNNQIAKNTTSPKIIKQETEYDKIGRAVKSCQFDVAQPSNKRCIETEHDAFGNIVKKEEAVYDQNNHKRNDVHGETREITYDLRNRPLTVTVDGLKTEEYSYNNGITGGNYFGYDTIKNKYKDIDPLITYKDKWGRAAKSVDPFGNNVEPHYNSTTWLTDFIVSKGGKIRIVDVKNAKILQAEYDEFYGMTGNKAVVRKDSSIYLNSWENKEVFLMKEPSGILYSIYFLDGNTMGNNRFHLNYSEKGEKGEHFAVFDSSNGEKICDKIMNHRDEMDENCNVKEKPYYDEKAAEENEQKKYGKYEEVRHSVYDISTSFKQNGKWGFLDDDGNVMIPAEYDEVTPFYFDVAWVWKGDRRFIIDRSGRVVVEIKPEWKGVTELRYTILEYYTWGLSGYCFSDRSEYWYGREKVEKIIERNSSKSSNDQNDKH